MEKGTFSPIPEDVYIKYDKMRQELVDEVFVRIKDALSYDNIDLMLKLINSQDENFLRTLKQKGATRATPDLKDIVTRCRSRNLIVSTTRNKHGHASYDLTQLGLDVLQAIDGDDKLKEKVRRRDDDE